MRTHLLLGTLALCLAGMITGCSHTPTPKEREQAIAQYQIGLSLVHEARGLGVEGKGSVADRKWRQALRELQKGAELDPNNAEIQYLLGMVYFVGFHREEETEKHLRRALKLKEGDYPEAQNLLGTALVQFGRPEDALPLLESARQNLLYETPYFAQQELGWALYKLERYDEAARHLTAALAAQPDLCGAYVRLADVEEQRDDWARVEEVLTRFLEHCDTDRLRENCGPKLLGYGYYRLGMAQLKLGNKEQAATSLKTCTTRFPREPVAEECSESLALLQ